MAYAKALGWKEFLFKNLKRGVSRVGAGKRKTREMPTVWLEREAGGVIKGPGS